MQQALLWPSMVVEWCLNGIVIVLGGGGSGGFNGFDSRRSELRMAFCIMKSCNLRWDLKSILFSTVVSLHNWRGISRRSSYVIQDRTPYAVSLATKPTQIRARVMARVQSIVAPTFVSRPILSSRALDKVTKKEGQGSITLRLTGRHSPQIPSYNTR